MDERILKWLYDIKISIKEIDGLKNEPIEMLTVNVPEEFSGAVIDQVTQRKGELLIMEPKGDIIHLEFSIPARGVIGLRNNLLTATQGEAIIAHRFKGYEPWKGDIPGRINGVLLSMDKGKSTAYSIDNLQDRGRFFIDPADEVYAGQVIGENSRPGDMIVNVTRTKKLTNMRASGSDDNVRIAPAVKFSLEECMEYIEKDEYLEITPKSLRMRKVHLDENVRKRMSRKEEAI